MCSFGKPFERIPTMFVKDCGYIPVVLTNAAFVIEKNIKVKYLFQTQGNLSKVNASLHQLAAPRLSRMKNANVHDVIEAMKAFLLRLPEPLLPEKVCESLITAQPEEAINQYLAVLTEFRNSSPTNFAILHFMMQILKKVSEYSEYNGMDVRKLATVFVLDVVKPLKLEDSNDGLCLVERMQRLPYLIMVVENIINQVDIFKTISSQKGVGPSPKGSSSSRSVVKSHQGLSPRMSRSNTTGGLAALTMGIPCRKVHLSVNSPKTEKSDSFAESSNKSGEDSKNKETERANVREGDASEKKPQEKPTRAMSEPQKESLLEMEIKKRCSTAVPIFFSDGIIKNSEVPGDGVKDLKGSGPSKEESNLKSEELVSEHETGTLSVTSTTVPSAKDKKPSIGRTLTLRGKQFRSILGTKRSPSRKRSMKKEQFEMVSGDVRHPRSVENKGSLNLDRRKRKFRSASKKSRSEHENTGNRVHVSGFTTFQPDEEITPWNEGSTNSDDNSVMTKTIKNPRILACKTTTPSKQETQISNRNTQKDRGMIISSEKVSKIFLAESGFRTISRQNERSVNSEASDTTTVSMLSYRTNMVLTPLEEISETPEVCVQFSSRENTPISKELIRGVKLKGSIGVNTSPCLKVPATSTNIEGVHNQRAPEKSKEIQNPITPVAAPREHKNSNLKRNSTPCVKNVTPAPPKTVTVSTLTDPALEPRKERNEPASTGITIRYPPPRAPQPPHQIHLSPRNSRVPNHVRFRQQLYRQKLTSLSWSRDMRSLQPPRSSQTFRSVCSEWFLDIILVFVTLFCTGFVFYIHQYNKGNEIWHV